SGCRYAPGKVPAISNSSSCQRRIAAAVGFETPCRRDSIHFLFDCSAIYPAWIPCTTPLYACETTPENRTILGLTVAHVIEILRIAQSRLDDSSQAPNPLSARETANVPGSLAQRNEKIRI